MDVALRGYPDIEQAATSWGVREMLAIAWHNKNVGGAQGPVRRHGSRIGSPARDFDHPLGGGFEVASKSASRYSRGGLPIHLPPHPGRHRRNQRSPPRNSPRSGRCLALIEACKPNGVDTRVYFTGVLTKLVNLWLASRIDELLPIGLGAGARDKSSSGVTPNSG